MVLPRSRRVGAGAKAGRGCREKRRWSCSSMVVYDSRKLNEYKDVCNAMAGLWIVGSNSSGSHRAPRRRVPTRSKRHCRIPIMGHISSSEWILG